MMHDPTFNLLDEPWIPCLDARGRVVELGLRETLIRAHEWRGVAGDTPVITAAILRLLLAVIYRAMGPPANLDHWGEVWQQGRWDETRLDAYFHRWHDRFDLFHPTHPFYQARAQNSKTKHVNPMIFHLAAGNNPTLFDHHTDAEPVTLTPAEAVQALLTVQAFSPAGAGGMAPKDSSAAPWTKGIIFLAEGDTLFHTLALNWMEAVHLTPYGLPTTPEDRPVWEMDDPFTPSRDTPLGITDYLTWPNRAIRFLPEWAGNRLVVRHAEMGSGLRLSDSVRDPFKRYRQTNRGFIPMQFAEERALWRDSATLMRFRHTKEGRSPAFFEWLALMVEYGILETELPYGMMALGLVSNQARIDFYREEHLPLPLSYLQKDDLVTRLQEAITLAENVHTKLKQALARLATLILAPTADQPDGRKPDKKDVNNLLSHWAVGRHYWTALEPSFYDLLLTLPRDPEAALHTWYETLWRAAEEAFAQAEAAAPNDARGLRAAVRARGQLIGSLKNTIPSPTPEVNHVPT